MSTDGIVALSVIAEGAADPSRFDSLTTAVGEIEVLRAPDGATRSPAELNAFVDGAASNWILVARVGEHLPLDLAAHIAMSIGSDAKAWGFRIAVRESYCGRPIRIGPADPGDVRLFHRRKARMQRDGRMKVQGTVVRLSGAIDRVLFESPSAHVEALRSKGGVEVGSLPRLVRWLGAILTSLPRSLSGTVRDYLWIEAGWRLDG